MLATRFDDILILVDRWISILYYLYLLTDLGDGEDLIHRGPQASLLLKHHVQEFIKDWRMFLSQLNILRVYDLVDNDTP